MRSQSKIKTSKFLTSNFFMIKNSPFCSVLEGINLKTVKVCTRIVKSISNSRKMLRFMRFIEGFRRFVSYAKSILRNINISLLLDSNGDLNYDMAINMLRVTFKLCGQIASILFYIFDDMVLLAQLKLINRNAFSFIIGQPAPQPHLGYRRLPH